MTNHDAAGPESALSCGRLFEALRQKIPGLQVKYSDNLCSMWSTGAVIAWASPVWIWGGMRVWFIGDSQSVKKFPASTISLKITSVSGMWGDCCGSFKISGEAQLAEAVELLFAVSHPLTITWFSQDARAFKTSRARPIGDEKVKVNQPARAIYTTLAGRQS